MAVDDPCRTPRPSMPDQIFAGGFKVGSGAFKACAPLQVEIEDSQATPRSAKAQMFQVLLHRVVFSKEAMPLSGRP